MFDKDTKYTITGSQFTNLKISSDHRRFTDDQVYTDNIDTDRQSGDISETLSIAVDYKAGIKKAANANVKLDGDSLQVTQLSIATRIRSKGLARFTLGVIYGVALWANKDDVWGLVDHSRTLEEMLINAGFPQSKIVVSDRTSTMYFEARLDQIDYNDEDFAIVRR